MFRRTEWTVETLRMNLLALRDSDILRNEQRFLGQGEAVKAALLEVGKALEKADAANEKRFDGVNEFRSTLKDQQSLFMTRTEVYALVGVSGVIGGIMGHFFR